MRSVSLLVACLLVCSLPAAASAAVSPKALVGSILSAARAQRSVHYVSVETEGNVQVTIVGDAGGSQGIQRVTFRKAGETGHVTVIVAANIAYVRGDAFTLASFMGFKPSAAAKYANRWFLIPPGGTGYAKVAAAVRFASTISQLTVPGRPAGVPAATIAGRRVVGVRGTSTDKGIAVVVTLYGRATGPRLPVRETVTRGALRGVVTFSRWNEPVQVAVPKNAVPLGQSI
jgi:hypothetical protein